MVKANLQNDDRFGMEVIDSKNKSTFMFNKFISRKCSCKNRSSKHKSRRKSQKGNSSKRQRSKKSSKRQTSKRKK